MGIEKKVLLGIRKSSKFTMVNVLMIYVEIKGTPYDFMLKTSKNEDFVKGTPYRFLSKNIKKWRFRKGYPLWIFIKKHEKMKIS